MTTTPNTIARYAGLAAFTLIEVLVVIALLGILVAILWPIVSRVSNHQQSLSMPVTEAEAEAITTKPTNKEDFPRAEIIQEIRLHGHLNPIAYLIRVDEGEYLVNIGGGILPISQRRQHPENPLP